MKRDEEARKLFVSMYVVWRLLGHDRLTTTEMYLNLSPEAVLREFRAKW